MATLGVSAAVRMHLAIGTTLAAMVPASLASARTHFAQGTFDAVLLQRLAAPLLAGAVIGIAFYAVAGERTLAVVFALFALPIALFLALDRLRRPLAAHPPRRVTGLVLPALIGGAAAATGMGGSTIGAPALVLGGMRADQASTIASAMGAIVSLPAAFGAYIAGWHAADLPPYSLGYVNLAGLALVAPILLAMEPAGAALAHLIDLKRLHLVFAALIAIITARMLWDALS
jgi:uncharacterized membrane protein YfcA